MRRKRLMAFLISYHHTNNIEYITTGNNYRIFIYFFIVIILFFIYCLMRNIYYYHISCTITRFRFERVGALRRQYSILIRVNNVRPLVHAAALKHHNACALFNRTRVCVHTVRTTVTRHYAKYG